MRTPNDLPGRLGGVGCFRLNAETRGMGIKILRTFFMGIPLLKCFQPDEEPQLPPLFITELLMELSGLYFTPNNNHYLLGITEIINRIQDTTLSVKNLVTDVYFDDFTRFMGVGMCACCTMCCVVCVCANW